MTSRYWVIGADYADCDFTAPQPGSQSLHGPYDCPMRARTEWQRLTFRDGLGATMRYAIAEEGRL